jgi:hypothetical protein
MVDIPIIGRRRGHELRVCRGCGCDDDHACQTEHGPCAWFLLEIDLPSGICTACAVAMGFDPAILIQAMCDLAFAKLTNLGYGDAAIDLAPDDELERGFGT